VKIGVVSHLGSFIEVLSPEYRGKYLSVICNLPDETENWRIRNELAKQLVHLALLYSPKHVQTSLVKLADSLYNDSYAEVRKTALYSVINNNQCVIV
jgi:serine/threonine-protein phosphatase 4 regulatory subunit 1